MRIILLPCLALGLTAALLAGCLWGRSDGHDESSRGFTKGFLDHAGRDVRLSQKDRGTGGGTASELEAPAQQPMIVPPPELPVRPGSKSKF